MDTNYKLKKGLVQVYTGNGKGKTTASLGLCLRAVGTGLQAMVVQFMKGCGETGELSATSIFGSRFVIKQFGTGDFNFGTKPTAAELASAQEGLDFVAHELVTGNYDIIVLDEISHAVNKGFLAVDDIVQVITNRCPQVEVVLTGRDMPAELLAIADLISEIGAVKHPYDQGIKARQGIEE